MSSDLMQRLQPALGPDVCGSANAPISSRVTAKRPRLKHAFDLSTVIRVDTSEDNARVTGNWPRAILERLGATASRSSTQRSKLSQDSVRVVNNSNCTLLNVDQQIPMTSSQLDNEPQITIISVQNDKPNNQPTSALPCPQQPGTSTSVEASTSTEELQESEPSPETPPSERPMPQFVGPFPPLIPPPFLPRHWMPRPGMMCAATPPIELTHWRLNPDFDPNPAAQQRGEENSRTGRESRPSAAIGTVLTPDNLPRIFPGSNVPQFTRLEEEFLDDDLKGCCGRVSQSALIRCFVAVISAIGLACVVVGIVLGALTVTGTTRLTLCLLMIGVGVVLITVSVIAWRLTNFDYSRGSALPCLFSNRSALNHQTLFPNARHPMQPPPFPPGVMMSEFGWRPPPPSYQASVREVGFERFFNNRLTRTVGSPPPTYRSNAEITRPSVTNLIESSRPPSYRSQESLNVIEERPLSELMQQTELRSPVTPQPQPDDRQHLIISSEESGRANPAYNTGAVRICVGGQPQDASVSVIDCSAAVPVGFEVDSGSNRSRKARHRLLLNSPRPRVDNLWSSVCYLPQPRPGSPCLEHGDSLLAVSDFIEIGSQGPSYV